MRQALVAWQVVKESTADSKGFTVNRQSVMEL